MAQHHTTHIYSTVRLAAKSGTTWDGEIAVFGMRLALFSSAVDPGSDAGDVELPEFLTNDAAVTRTPSGWSVDQGWTGDSSLGVEVTDADQDSIADAWLTFLTGAHGQWPSMYTLQDVRLYNIGRDGRTGSAPNIYTPASAYDGGAAYADNPAQAVCVSFGSAMRGRQGRGRFYFGPLGSNVLNNYGQILAASQDSIGNAAATLLSDLEAVGGIDVGAHPVIVHRASLNGLEHSAHGAIINSVRVGNEVDSQQRRRRQVPEVYTSY